MKKCLILFAALFIQSCDKLEYQPEQYEEGVVSYMRYDAPYDTYSISTDDEGNFDGIDTHHHPAKYVLKFRCEHGEFQISNSHARELFHNFRMNDKVIITYRQVDRVKYKDDVEVERHFHDWDFITAVRYDENTPREK